MSEIEYYPLANIEDNLQTAYDALEEVKKLLEQVMMDFEEESEGQNLIADVLENMDDSLDMISEAIDLAENEPDE